MQAETKKIERVTHGHDRYGHFVMFGEFRSAMPDAKTAREAAFASGMLDKLRAMTNEWAEPLGQIARNCGALDPTVALDGLIAEIRRIIAKVEGKPMVTR